LARTSLCVLFAMVATATAASCLVSSTPTDLEPARRTPPILSGFNPDAFKILPIPRINPAAATFAEGKILFDVVSEDLGSNLYAAVVLDYKPLGPNLAGLISTQSTIPPGHIDDPPRHREIRFTVLPGTTPGCHSLTLVVTHAFKAFDPTPADAADAAIAVWWVDVDDDITAPKATLSPCSAPFDGGLSGGS
jgi:hypothetical protein